MPSLTDKLKSLGVQVGTNNIDTPSKKESSLSLLDVLDGEWQNTSAGECFVVNKFIPSDSKHGKIALNQNQKPLIFDRLPGLGGISEISIYDYLFIDTETSSLSGGAGSYVFLIGAAKYTKSGIHFKQFFLDDPSLEPGLLAALEQFASSAKAIISYNGKAFDLPRINTRYKIHSWPSPFDGVYHVDLLHIVRRLWKDHLPSCNLGEIEYHILDVTRSELDVPGFEISGLFFDYLQSGDPNPLKSVFYHNEIDVISLISLYTYVLSRLANPLSDFGEDSISMGIYLSHLNFITEAINVLENAVKPKSISPMMKLKGMENLARLYKKNNDYSKAVPLWKEITTFDIGISPYIELAIFYEHTEKDFQEAAHWTLSAIDKVSEQPRSAQSNKLIPQLQHRLARLKKKLSTSPE